MRSRERIAYLFDLQTGPSAHVPTHKGDANAIAVSPDGKFCATCGNDGRVILHDVHRRVTISQIEIKKAYANCLTFLPDGRTVAAGVDERIVLWDGTSRKPLAELSLGVDPINLLCLAGIRIG